MQRIKISGKWVRDMSYTIRKANENDVPVILQFIKELAEYEQLLHEVVATEDLLKRNLFDRKSAHVLIAESGDEAVGFALYFYNFSTFLGKPNLYLEDLYVKPTARGTGVGKGLLAALGQIAIADDCERLDWWCLDWNEKSIEFYKSLGAVPMDEWTVYRMTGKALIDLANMGAERGQIIEN